MKYSKPIEVAIIENADQQELLNKTLDTATNAYTLIDEGHHIFRKLLLYFAARKIAKLEYTIELAKKRMHELVNHIHVTP